MNVQLSRCNNETRVEKDCFPQEEITKQLHNKFFVTLVNEICFEQNKYDGEAVLEESRINWLPINTQFQQIIPY